jgi:rubrerythrin
MIAALPDAPLPLPDALAAGGTALLEGLLGAAGGREDALPLLAADALLTAALQAQAELDPEGLAALAERIGPAGAVGALASPAPGDVPAMLQMCREAEKEQALFYRSLAVAAEEAGDAGLAERFQELHADEQHHLSRLTARLLELGAVPAELGHVRASGVPLHAWETAARRRERDEVKRYTILLEQRLDDATLALATEILGVERRHAEVLGGKWTPA